MDEKKYEASERYFENRACAYYPCHGGNGHINCLFCYCPLYFLPACPGNSKLIEVNGKSIKSCMDCRFPHEPENYDRIMAILKNACVLRDEKQQERRDGGESGLS